MCAEFVKEINTLLDMSKSNLQNALRLSYLVSQHVDLETQQVDTFSACIDLDAENDPKKTLPFFGHLLITENTYNVKVGIIKLQITSPY